MPLPVLSIPFLSQISVCPFLPAALGRYNAIGPAVHRINYFSEEKEWFWDKRIFKKWRTIPHWPRGGHIADAHLNKSYDLILTFDQTEFVKDRNITNVQPVAGTPQMYLGNRYVQQGPYWIDDRISDFEIHILTEWVGTCEGYEFIESRLAQKP